MSLRAGTNTKPGHDAMGGYFHQTVVRARALGDCGSAFFPSSLTGWGAILVTIRREPISADQGRLMQRPSGEQRTNKPAASQR
jgi:hypothetical protein